MNLSGILIGSEDPQRLKDYYTKLFDKPGWEGGDFTGWQIGSGWLTDRSPRPGQGQERHPGSGDLEHRDGRREGRVRAAAGRWRDRGGCRPITRARTRRG